MSSLRWVRRTAPPARAAVVLLLGLWGLLLVASAPGPCLWDSDTLDTELRGLPDAFDLVVGRWHRHSQAYYEQRVERLAGRDDLTLGELDDLAVAYERLGRRDDAIDVMAAKASALAGRDDVEHRYRYLANVGTFYAHAGRYDEALAALREAVALNPDAHFGRERFQIEVIEYVAAAKASPDLWRRRSFLRHAGYGVRIHLALGDYEYNPDDRADWAEADWLELPRELDWDEAYRGVAGMLRFGGREGAELYRALGELFLHKGHLNLGWWALRRAVERGHPAAANLRAGLAAIEAHWREAAEIGRLAFELPTEELYLAERARADRWLEAFQRAEDAAIARGDDVTTGATLATLLAVADRAVPAAARSDGLDGRTLTWAALVASLLCLAALLLLRRRAGAAS